MYFFGIPVSIGEVVAVIPNGAKIFFARGAATFINGPAILLNNEPKILQFELFYIFEF